MLTYRISAMTHAMLLTGVDCNLDKLNNLNEFLTKNHKVSIHEFNSKAAIIDVKR